MSDYWKRRLISMSVLLAILVTFLLLAKQCGGQVVIMPGTTVVQTSGCVVIKQDLKIDSSAIYRLSPGSLLTVNGSIDVGRYHYVTPIPVNDSLPTHVTFWWFDPADTINHKLTGHNSDLMFKNK